MERIKEALAAAIGARARLAPAEFSPLLVELNSASVWFKDAVAHIGPWRLEVSGEQLLLVRQPPPSPTRLIYSAVLLRDSQGWLVQDLDARTVRAR